MFGTNKLSLEIYPMIGVCKKNRPILVSVEIWEQISLSYKD
jgi:hypothetical protein